MPQLTIGYVFGLPVWLSVR